MWSPSRRTYCVLPAILFLSLSISVLTVLLPGCSKKQNEPEQPSGESEQPESEQPSFAEAIVLQTDSTEWWVRVIATGKLYAEAVTVPIPDPYRLPVKEEAQVLRTCTLSSSERFITSDGYTFGMPSASVSKAGQKTKYSVLGLSIRKTVIDVPF